MSDPELLSAVRDRAGEPAEPISKDDMLGAYRCSAGVSYEITWKAGASRDMDRLPLAIASAVVEFIYGPLAQNPRRVGKPLRFELAGEHSARRGNCRVIFEILETAVQIEVIAVQHRADGYRENRRREGVPDLSVPATPRSGSTTLRRERRSGAVVTRHALFTGLASR